METRELVVERATAEALRPFGEIVGGPVDMDEPGTSFYGAQVKTTRPTFISDEETEVAVCTLTRRPLEVRWMERHFKHTQVFLPLGGKPFIAVLAPPTDSELPNLDDARAFLFDGQVGLSMHIGTWHEFPFALIDGTQLVVLLRKETSTALKPENVLDGEGVGPDLDKKDITRRLGVVLKPQL